MMIKLLNLKRQFYLLVLFLSVTSTLIAQNSNEKQKLQGKWILEEASVLKIEGRDSIVMDIETLNSIYFDVAMHILPKLEFQGDSLSVVSSDFQLTDKVYANEGQLKYDALPISINLDFNVRNSKLILHKLYTSHNGAVFDIVLTYHKD